MAVYYIAGISGSGKSSLVQLLKEDGYEAYDADDELCSWFDNNGTAVEYPRNEKDRPIDWQDHHKFLISEQKVRALATKLTDIFICGVAPNDLELASKYFAKVLFLHIPEDEMIRRVSTRTNNKYGHAADQLAHMKKWYTPTIEKYRDYGATVIDAMQPAEVVKDEVLRLSRA